MEALQFLTRGTKLTNYSVIPNDLHGGELSSTATILYSKLLNRSNLSITNGKVDEVGRIYINYKLEDFTENRPYKGQKTVSSWGGKLATNNNNKQETITSYKYGEDTF